MLRIDFNFKAFLWAVAVINIAGGIIIGLVLSRFIF